MKENKDIAKLRNRIKEGMKLSTEKLIAEKKQLGRKVGVIVDGVLKEIDPA